MEEEIIHINDHQLNLEEYKMKNTNIGLYMCILLLAIIMYSIANLIPTFTLLSQVGP